jgi:hypothetical protein
MKRKADFDVVMLVVALVVALALLMIGISITNWGGKKGGAIGSEYSVKEAVAYGQLKLKCGLWRNSIDTSDGPCSDNQQCLANFMSDSLKIYGIPYYVRNSRLLNSAYYDTAESPETKKCDAAIDTLSKSARGEAAQATMDIGAAIKKINEENDPVKSAELKVTVNSCARVCTWVSERDDECRISAKACGDFALEAGAGATLLSNLLP